MFFIVVQRPSKTVGAEKLNLYFDISCADGVARFEFIGSNSPASTSIYRRVGQNEGFPR